MMKTLYLDDSYMRECDAVVLEVMDNGVVLDQTIFYPRGGGQPCDTGKVVAPDRELRVLSVMKKDGKIIHELESGGLKADDRVHLVLDWERRYRFMRMHTAAHVLAATMHTDMAALITGNELGQDKTRFDFNTESFDRALFDAIVKKVNGLLAQDVELRTYSLPREEAMKIPGVVKLANALPPSITVLRIVEIPGIDVQADGGTHVRNLKEVGQIELLKLENKGKTNRRIYFALRP
jgi:Ser-tRNA(Ala) deacylase AlaX